MFYQWQGDNLVLNIRVQPRASNDAFAEVLGEPPNEQIKIRITAAPVDGKANKHLVSYLASVFKVAKSSISIVGGETGRNKQLVIVAPKQLPEFIPSPQSD